MEQLHAIGYCMEYEYIINNNIHIKELNKIRQNVNKCDDYLPIHFKQIANSGKTLRGLCHNPNPYNNFG